MIRLDAILAHAARADPRRTAVAFGGVTCTYGEVVDRARRLASGLASLGVGAGDRVAFWSSNRPEFVEFLFGVPLLGAIAVPMDHWWKAGEALAALAQCRPKALVAAGPQAELLAGLHADLESTGVAHRLALDEPPEAGWSSYAGLIAAASPIREPRPASLDDPALILFTSGSTGSSKGAVHTHRDLAHTALTMALELGLREGERTLHFLPLFSSCLEHLIPLTLMRATHVILPDFDAGRVWEEVDAQRITHFDAVPTALRRLLDGAPPALPSSLRLVSYASEPMPAPLISAWTQRAPSVDFVQFYGMIEHLCVTVQKPWEQVSKIGTVGKPMLGTELRLQTPDGAAVRLGETGEVSARSSSQMLGYWQDPAATAEVVHDGWMRTGDLGRLDGDGYLVLEGRLKEVIKSGGMTVVPREVEEALLRHPSVREAAVVGVPDERWGEAAHAFVTLTPGANVGARELQTYCRGRLAGYKCPKGFHIVGELPRTGIGKIARRELRELALGAERAAPTA